MSTNKHALIRYRVIDRCLRQVDKQWNWKSLSEACSAEIETVTGKKTSLSERTIKGDIQNMRNDEALGYFAPIEYDRSEKSYYYSNRSYSITEAPLNKSDSNELKQMIALLRQFTGFQHLEGIDNIVQKLELLAYESTTPSKRIVHIEQPTTIPGQQWLDMIYDAIRDESTMLMTYAPFNKKPSSMVISPYLLKEYDNRWYLYAKNHEKNQLRTYGLERIKNMQPSLQDYRTEESFDPEQYFSNIIGVTLEPNKKLQKIHFSVKGATIQYIATKPLHQSQKMIEKGDMEAIFEIAVIPNFELESLILSFGEAIEILKPAALRRKLDKRVAAMYSAYSE